MVNSNYLIGNEENFNYWNDKYQIATDFMEKRSNNKSILIEVAAQHPLKDGLYPNEEFELRLKMAIELSNKEVKNNVCVKIFVPGSVHLSPNGSVELTSLSNAGIKYLIQSGISKKDIYGEEKINKYKGEAGVYNSADECYVASQIFIEEYFGKLYCVCSPAQMQRKTFYYLEFGIIPMNYTVPVANMYHNYIRETFHEVPHVLFIDHTAQKESSLKWITARQERKQNEDGV